jgi:hypothetical protein
MKTPPEIAIEIFRVIPDPRVERTKEHRLEVIMFVALCTYLSGGEGFYNMQAYAQARKDWLRDTVGMQSVPSHDTFNRVFQAISPECFGKCLIELSHRLRKKYPVTLLRLTVKHIVATAVPTARRFTCSMPGLWKIAWCWDRWQ